MTDNLFEPKKLNFIDCDDQATDHRFPTPCNTSVRCCEEDPATSFTAFTGSMTDRRGNRLANPKLDKARTGLGQSPFSFAPVGDLQYRAPEYLVDELFETETLGLIFGDPGCGKSFLAVDLGMSVASGTPFHGRAVKQGSVFFIAGEGHNGLARRFAAWSKARNVPLSGVPLFKSERAAQFLNGRSANAVGDAVALLAEQHGQPVLIIVDTLARNFGAGDENNTKDMSEFVTSVDDLKARFPGCTVLILHHSGHAEKQRARGAMALKGALDAEYRVEKTGMQLRLVNTKMKDAETPQDIHFQFRQVDLVDANSAVLEVMDAAERKAKLTSAQRLGLDTYITAAAAQGFWEDGAFRGVRIDAWRDAFYAKHTGENVETKKKAFQRVRKSLLDDGHIEIKKNIGFSHDAVIQSLIMQERDKRDKPGQTTKCPDGEAG
jgi:hypothetical protein